MSYSDISKQFPEYHQYIIIGAGISGLHAAQILAQHQQDFIILQASNNIGGRIATDCLGDIIDLNNINYDWTKSQDIRKVPVETGATWISVQHIYMIHLVKQLELNLFPQYFDGLSIYGFDQNNYSKVLSIRQHYKKHKNKMAKLVDKIDNLAINLWKAQQQKDKQLMQEYVNLYDNITLSQFIQQQLKDLDLAEMIKRQIQTLQCISCDKLSVLQILQDGGSLQLVKLYCQRAQDTVDGLKVKKGALSIINKIKDKINQILQDQDDTQLNISQRNDQFLRLNQPVQQIINQITQDVLIRTRKNNYYSCKKVLFSVPIAVANMVKISKISESKKLIFENQEYGKITRKYFVFKQAFWRSKYCGYGSFSKKFPFNQLTQLSPSTLDCGILAFIFVGLRYEELVQNQFKKQQDPKLAQQNYFLKIIADMFLNGDINHPSLKQSFSFSRTFTYNEFIKAAYQSTTKPSIWKQIQNNGDDYSEAYSRDQYNIIYIGSQYAQSYSTYMEGALRLCREKVFKIVGKKDPWLKLLEEQEV